MIEMYECFVACEEFWWKQSDIYLYCLVTLVEEYTYDQCSYNDQEWSLRVNNHCEVEWTSLCKSFLKQLDIEILTRCMISSIGGFKICVGYWEVMGLWEVESG